MHTAARGAEGHATGVIEKKSLATLQKVHAIHTIESTRETTGAVHPDAVGMLYAWHAETRAEGCIDRTVYGTSRTATTSFFTHHHCATPAPHLARRRDRRGAPRRHLGEIQEISPP